ncbi:hypothetical protein [Nostoc edaphicum]|nr:hypothetical protein [Nostoc edaphicum]
MDFGLQFFTKSLFVKSQIIEFLCIEDVAIAHNGDRYISSFS